MDLHMIATGAIGFLAVALCCLVFLFRQVQAEPSPQLVLGQVGCSDPAACLRILACKGYENTGATNLYSGVRSRAIPNQRLVRAFGIDNSFTTSDEERRKKFNKKAGNAIKMSEAKWQEVAFFAEQLVDQAISPSKSITVGQTSPVTLDSLVRSVCLKIVLHILFDSKPLELDDGDILVITESINSLWIQSKGTREPLESDKNGLQQALVRIKVQEKPSSGPESPLNLILPAYETLWRVVLSGFLQVTFVQGVPPMLRSVLASFLLNPTSANRKQRGHGPEASAVSVDHIVKEALRLYPSVKRVKRQVHMDNAAGPENVEADIEACQRTEALWGADAQRFVPSRWINVSKEAQTSYMAFGVSPFVCPAKADFGPMIIGILVAAFAGHVSSTDCDLKLGENSSDAAQLDFDKALSGEEPLVSDRSTYEGIRLIKK